MEASLRTLDTLISRFRLFAGRPPPLPLVLDALANSARPLPKLLAWPFGPLDRRRLFAAQEMLYIAWGFVVDEPEKVALRVIFGEDAVRVIRLDEEAAELLLAVDVEDRNVGTWNEEDEADGEGEGRLLEGIWFAAEEVKIGTCRLAVPRMHLRLRLVDEPAVLEGPETDDSRD
jgi:hypothetical protein